MKKDKPSSSFGACGTCDVNTMARRLGFTDPRRVQQLGKEGTYKKNAHGEYFCEQNVLLRFADLTKNRTTKASELTQKSLEKLEIQILREKAQTLKEHSIVTQDAAVIEELAPVMVAFKTSIRELRSVLVDQIALFCKEYHTSLLDGKEVPDHALKAKVQAMLAKPLDDRLQMLSSGIEEWKKKKGKK